MAAIRGMLYPGNIDLDHRPVVMNPDGTYSTIRSMSIGTDNGEVLIPTVSDDGKVLDEESAIRLYEATGKHLGIFQDPDSATEFAKNLHNSQDKMYRNAYQRAQKRTGQ